ncbi:MAG: large repetitive protein, partial [Actinomycetota bacterium]|nr:large repetitive protein [Actinomycetota bacterium]
MESRVWDMAASLSERRRWLAIGLMAAAGIAGAVAVAAPGSAGTLSASAAASPTTQTVGDAAGSAIALTVKNTSRTEPIDGIDIRRPGASWTVTGCPAGPLGWSRTASAGACRYRSAAGPAGDLRPGATVTSFRVRVTTAPSAADRTGTWSVVAYRDAQRPAAATVAASPSGAGLRGAAYSLQVTDVVVAARAPRPGTACPSAVHQAKATTSVVLVACGRNASTAPATLAAARATLSGNFASGGVFSSGPIPARSPIVVLGSWSGSHVAPVAATGRIVGGRVGAAAYRTSAPFRFGRYTSTDGAPTVAAVDGGTTRGISVELVVTGSDPDGDSLTFGTVTAPSHGTVGAFASPVCSGSRPRTCSSRIVYTPAAGFSGSDAFTYAATDGVLNSAAATVNISVAGGNSRPVAQDDNLATASDTALTADVRINDTDPDGTALTVSAVDVAGTKGAVTIGSDGNIVYDPRGAFPGLVPGASTTDVFHYSVTDGELVSSPASVTVTVTAPSSPPSGPPSGP